MSNYYSRIKDIFIQIHGYDFFHSPTDYIKKDNRLISREILTKRLRAFLVPVGNLFSGVYLVTGFRGIGKTTLVRSALIAKLGKSAKVRRKRVIAEAIVLILFSIITYLIYRNLYVSNNLLLQSINNHLDILGKPLYFLIQFLGFLCVSWFCASRLLLLTDVYKKRTNKVHRIIELNLSQDALTEFDVLKSMAWSIYDEYKQSLKGIRAFINFIGIIVLIMISYHLMIGLVENMKIQSYSTLKEIITFFLFKTGVFVILFFLQFFLLRKLFDNIHKIGFITHRHVLSRLSRLNDRINASLVEDERTSFKHFEFNLDFGGKSRSYDKVDSKEIEYELTQIIKMAGNVHFGLSPKKFVIVFDELDKVDFGKEYGLSSVNGSSKTEYKSNYYDLNPERRRREYIANLLGSLKHFFSTAKAKFIFIAGSEMFDASLADSTERDSFFGSVFHDIFYVPSFYTDEDNRTSDIKALTERYLCRFLIPPDLQSWDGENKSEGKYELNLKGYSNYLRKTYFLDNVMCDEGEEESRKMLANKSSNSYSSYQTIINKTVYTLYNFIMYLTSRSNGSPKKLTKLLEEHLVKDPERNKELTNRPFYLISADKVASKSNMKKGMYLYFQELDQYKFGFNTYLFHPFYFTHSVYLTNHSDKLLVASSFLLSHFYKFHSLAFSRHSLEYTPEVVSYSKVPELRKFMEGLFDTISNKHIQNINSGLQTHRFRDRIASEIEFVSKILQQESAVYNFTLDESLPLKRFYSSKIKEFEIEYQDYSKDDDVRNPFAISHLNSLLADLHFFDKDYEDSLTYYHNALKYLAYIRQHTINTFTHYISNLLKIGLTYEKTKQYERAHGVYSRANEELFKFVGFDYNGERSIKDRTGHKELFLYSATFLLSPAIARFALFEKGGSNGVTYEDYERLTSQINCILSIDKKYKKENFLIKSELRHKIGNIFFFKNSSILMKHNESWINQFLDNSHSQPTDALYIYFDNLKNVLSNLKVIGSNAKSIKAVLRGAVKVANRQVERGSNRVSGRFARKLSNYLSKLGDAFLCFDKPGDEYDGEMVYQFTSILDGIKLNQLDDNAINGWEKKPIFIATLCYNLSAMLIYEDDPMLASQRYLKVLYVIKDKIKAPGKVTGLEKRNEEGETLAHRYLVLLEDNIVSAILFCMNEANEGTRRLSLQQFKINADLPFQENLATAKEWIPPRLNKSKVSDLYPLIFNSSSNSAETLEVVIVFSEIILKLKGLESGILNPAHGFNSINNQFNRMWELWHKVHLNNLVWNDPLFHSSDFFKLNFKGSEGEKGNLIQRTLIVDSIYCLTEIIRSHKVFGLSYVHNYTTLAKAHKKLGEWCKRISIWVNKDNEKQKEITAELEKLIHQESTTYLHENYHFERSYEYHKAAINMHSGGKEYQQIIKQMYFGEDDLDDESQHFSAAIERSSLMTKKKLRVLRKKFGTSEIHKFENFKFGY